MLITRGEKLYIDEAHNVSIKESLEENSPTNSYIMTQRMQEENDESSIELNHDSSMKRWNQGSPTPNRLNNIKPGRIANSRSP